MAYTLGLDIGIASVGWALLDYEKQRILDLGVRLFEGAENAKDGASLAAPRREARGARKRTRRKARRMRDLRQLFVSRGLLTEDEMDLLFIKRLHTDSLFPEPRFASPWELRAFGLDHLLPPLEFARILFHIAKHRGFKSNRTLSPQEKDAKLQQDGKANASMKSNKRLREDGGYRTIGEMVWKDEKFAAHKRNKGGDYTNTVSREDLEQEIKALFASQRRIGNPYAREDIEKEYMEIFARQLPFASGESIEQKTGNCTFEPDCKRAPKAAWTAERFMLLGKIANLRIRAMGRKHELSIDETHVIEQLAHSKAKVTYKQIREALQLDSGCGFADLPFSRKDQDKDPEEKTFVELKAYHQFRRAITKALGEAYWEKLLSLDPGILDTLALGLTFRKTDEDIRDYLSERQIDAKLIEAVLPLNFSGVIHLSLKALAKLIPHMEQGNRYDKACVLAGYDHSNPDTSAQKHQLLPVLANEEIRNPVVFRALTQMRKVVNAIIRKYGTPEEIHVELSRDLGKSREERNNISKRQDQNQNDKDRNSKLFHGLFDRSPSSTDLLKFRLWKEQRETCAYSLKHIDAQLAFGGSDASFVEIDHIIPYSISFDDGFNNKALVFGSENRNKKNQTPYQYLGANETNWNNFTAWVDVTYKHNKKKAENLKQRDLGENEASEMKERNLTDTRYITSFAAKWLEKNLLFSGGGAKKENSTRVLRINGRMTYKLRHQWGLGDLKKREVNNLHHALDACVVAAATQKMVRDITVYYSKREALKLLDRQQEGSEKERFPEPWPGFRKELRARLSPDPAKEIAELGLANYTEEDLKQIKPIFISIKPERKAHGSAHKETIHTAKFLSSGITVKKELLTNVDNKVLERMYNKERDWRLYNDIKARLLENDDKPEKAFKPEFRRNGKDGKPGQIVKSIKVCATQVSGLPVRKGIAENEKMVRVDVYYKGKFFLIPYYVNDVAENTVKDRAITQGKDRSSWDRLDSSYKFCFSLFKNDLVRIIDRTGKELLAYYKTTHSRTGAVNLLSHDGSKEYEGIGVKTARVFEKHEVDVLGEYHLVKGEKPPHELA